MADDAATEEVVLFGGSDEANLLGDTWTWDGSEWTEQKPFRSPSARWGATMAYDAATQEVILFGGIDETAMRGDTWTWDGDEWIEWQPVTSPPARVNATMAYDAATEEVVLFGGAGEEGTLDDTWTWNGTEWIERHPGTSPVGRHEATMAYDATTAQVVLFSGSRGVLPIPTDTWTWDGSEWTEQDPATRPPGRYGGTMAYDQTSGRVLVFGGQGELNGGALLSDTWTGGLKATQTINFPTIADHRLGAPDIEPGATASSALPVTYTSQTEAVCTIVSGKVHLVATGECKVTAEQAGDAEWEAAPPVQRSFQVEPRTQTIAFPTIADHRLGAPDIEPGATASSALPVTYTSQTEAVCTIVSGKVHLVATGECKVTAEQAGDAEWEAAPSVQRSFQVEPKAQPQPEPQPRPDTGGPSTQITLPPPPGITIRHRPRRGNLDNAPARYTVVLGKAAAGVTFYCSLDRGPFKRCGTKIVYRHLRPGPHVFRVKSVDGTGQASPIRVIRFSAAGRRR